MAEHLIKEREKELHDKWKDKNQNLIVNNHQQSFDTAERQESFIKRQFNNEIDLNKYNKYRESWYERPYSGDAGDMPLAVTVELTSSCDLECTMCYTITSEFKNTVLGAQKMLPWLIVKQIIDECAELKIPSILFSWRGESSLYKSQDESGNTVDFADVLKYAREKGILEISSLTNGQSFNNEMIDKIIDAEPNWISFSIDGLEEAYNKIRNPKNIQKTNSFKNVTSNISKLIEMRNKQGKLRPGIRTNTIYPAISGTEEEYYNYLKNLGVDWITVNEMEDTQVDERDESEIIENWMCQYPFQRLTIAASGLIYPCTGAHDEPKDLLLGRYKGTKEKQVLKNGIKKTVLAKEMTINDAWNCEKIKKIRKLHLELKRKNINTCRNCAHGAVRKGVKTIPKWWDIKEMKRNDDKI